MKKYTIAIALILTACGADQKQNNVTALTPKTQPAQNPTVTPPTTPSTTPPIVEDPYWCVENDYWKPGNGGCELKAQWHPDHPSWRMVISKPKPIEVLTDSFCQNLEERGFNDWTWLLLGTDESALAAMSLNFFYTTLLVNPSYANATTKLWAEYTGTTGLYYATQFNAFLYGYNPNPLPANSLNFAICMRIIAN